MEPISLHLMDKGCKPVHARPYTVPRSVEQQLRKEIARLVEIGVLLHIRMGFPNICNCQEEWNNKSCF